MRKFKNDLRFESPCSHKNMVRLQNSHHLPPNDALVPNQFTLACRWSSFHESSATQDLNLEALNDQSLNITCGSRKAWFIPTSRGLMRSEDRHRRHKHNNTSLNHLIKQTHRTQSTYLRKPVAFADCVSIT